MSRDDLVFEGHLYAFFCFELLAQSIVEPIYRDLLLRAHTSFNSLCHDIMHGEYHSDNQFEAHRLAVEFLKLARKSKNNLYYHGFSIIAFRLHALHMVMLHSFVDNTIQNPVHEVAK